MKNISTSLILIIFFLHVSSVSAYNLKQVADKEYMSNSSITSFCQDGHGLMWIGTCDGLNIYDGRTIEEFKIHEEEDFLSGNLIDKVVYTGDDVYWIQTYYGLNRLERKTNTITHYNEFQKLFLMSKDNDGHLFIIQDSNCIYYYNKVANCFKKISTTGILVSDILNFFVDENNLMWIVMKGYNCCYDIQQNVKTGDVTLIPQKSVLEHQTYLSYCFNDDQYLYYIDKECNFYAYHMATRQNKFVANLEHEIQARGKVSSILCYHDCFFVSFLMDGILVLEKNKQEEKYDFRPLPINSGVFCLSKDRFQDVVWIGTDGQGVYLYSTPLYSIKSEVLGSYMEQVERPVRALFQDDERTLWVGTKGNGILKIYNYEVEKKMADCRREILLTSNSGLKSNAVYCFAKSRRNLLWIGDEEGLNYYSYQEKRIKKIPVRVDNEDFKYIHSIFETNDSELWMASVGMGVVKARIAGTATNPVLEDVQRYTINDGEFGSNYFFTIYADNEMELLFGNRGYGAFRYNKALNGLEPVSTHKCENMTMNNVLAIDKDSCNNYLFGTSYGLIKYMSETEYQLFNSKNGFRNNTIHAILKNNTPNDFWLSTNQGLINFNSERDVFRLYGFGDGLKVLEFSDGAAYRDEKTGTLFFGGINGFVAIRADGRPEQHYMPPIYFDKLSIFGKQCNLGEFIVHEKEKEVLNLRYNQNFFSLSFSSVDYVNSNNCTFSYKLKGLSEQWISCGAEREISFTNMAPGEYTLQVKYYNSVFDKESDIYSLLICICAPWYASWWAYLIYLMFFFSLIALLIRSFVLRSKRKKQELLNDLEKRHQKNVFESKLRFFTNIAHEFCTPLTLIYTPCERILASKGLSKSVVNYVQMIRINANRLNTLIHELIEFRRIETGNRKVHIEMLDISLLMTDIINAFDEMAKAKNIVFQCQVPTQLKWNSDKGFLNTIIINLLSNAFHYTPAGKNIKVEVNVDEQKNTLLFHVQNEGNTIQEKDFKDIFNRYAILDSFENQEEKGDSRNGLGLAISYNMAKLLNGMLTVESLSDDKVMFTLALPMAEPTAEVEMLHRMTAEYIPQIDTRPSLELSKPDFDKIRPTLLIVNDEVEILWLISEIFSDDFNVVTLQEPEKMEGMMNEVYPDIIICDAMMSGVSGMDLTRRMKSVKEWAHIPIIIVSGRHDMEEQMAALSAGVELYVTMPFNAEYLRVSVCQILERKEMLKDYFSSAISSFDMTDGKLAHKESKRFLQAVLKIINDHIQNKELTSRFIAEQLAISVRSLYRKMEELGEVSPANMIKECRLHVAKELLMKTKKTIDEVGIEAGFTNKVTFFKLFREKYGCTPKEFRTKFWDEIQ